MAPAGGSAEAGKSGRSSDAIPAPVPGVAINCVQG